MSARREHRLRNLERRVAELETIAATPVFIHTKGDGGEDYVLEAVWSKEEADTHPDKRLSLQDRHKNINTGGHEKKKKKKTKQQKQKKKSRACLPLHGRPGARHHHR